MNKHTDIRQKALALLLALCLLMPGLAAAAQPWQEQELPYGAKLRAGTIFYTDAELTEEQGTLLMDAPVLVNEVRGKAAAISYTAKKETKTAWVEGKSLILLNIATPTDLPGLIENEDVVLMPPAALEFPEEPEEQPTEEPTEELVEPTEEPNDEPVEEPAKEPAEELADNPGEEPAENPDKEPTEEPSEEKPSEELAKEPSEEPAEGLAEEPSEESDEEETEELTEETAEEPAEESSEEETEEVAEEPVPEETEEPEEYAFGSLEDVEQEEEFITEEELHELSVEGVNPETSSIYVMEEDQLVAAVYQPESGITLPEVRNQNPFGTCWAFAAVGAMEIDLIKANQTENSSIDLSEFFLAYFAAHNYPYPKEGGEGDSVSVTINDNDKGYNYLDLGGLSAMAYHILASLIGTTTEEANPYPVGRSEAEKLPSDYTNIAAQIVGAYNLKASDTDALKKQIQEHGSVKVSICMPNNSKDMPYNTAISLNGGKVAYNESTASLYGTYKTTNHDVLLVGWNDNYSRNNFLSELRPESNGAWKARNSWGTGFGQNGYFWISYEDASLLSSRATSYDAENKDVADYCYSYDKTYSTITGKKTVSDQAVIKQSFMVAAKEKLQSVGIEVSDDNITMELNAIVRVNGKEVSRSDTRKADYSGFYNLKLKTPYVTQQETVVEVEVICTSSGNDIQVPYQANGERTLGNAIGQYKYKYDYGTSGGFTVNGDYVKGDSTIKLYTKKNYSNSSNNLVSKIILDKTEIVYINSGDSFDLKVDKIEPANATNKTLQWYTSDEYVARLVEDKDGIKVVGAGKGGTAVITAMSTNGVYASCTVEVTPKSVPVTAIRIKNYNNDAHTFTINESTGGGFKIGDRLILEAELTPWNTTQTDVTWTTTNSSVMSITRVTGNTCEVLVRKNGEAQIKVVSDDNDTVSDYIAFTVNLPVHVSSVYLNYVSYGLWEGESVQLKATVLPTDADDQHLTWTSSNPEVATVTGTGLVTAKKDGKTVITVTTRDGGLTFSCDVTVATRDPVAAFVYRMYRVCLLREPDAGGLQTWVNELKRGARTGAEVAYGFFDSAEMRNRNLSNADFVERCYEGIMGRASDAAGKSTWVQKLEGGMSRKAVISGFTGSQEFAQLCAYYGIYRGSYQSDEPRDKNDGVTAFVCRLYTKMLGRTYDPDGLNTWCGKILSNPTKANVLTVALDGFMHSQEFLNKNLNDMEFVKVLYRTFLGREYDAPGLADWVSRLNSGMTRDQVASGFAYSQEFAQIMASYGL
ncbi:DUF4214 domain-containing protein [Clostridiales bacterium FE2011]|nr:DUF4214 domain-containing protein [Clostridiales bacterium FE2011]